VILQEAVIDDMENVKLREGKSDKVLFYEEAVLHKINFPWFGIGLN
jgi:hypothetical protein